MNVNNKTARLVGALFLICNFTFLLGAVGFLEPILSDSNYLNLIYLERNRVAIGVILELMNGVAYLGIAVVMYTVLRSHYECIIVAYLGFRMIEFVMQVLADLSPLSLLSLSEDFVTAGARGIVVRIYQHLNFVLLRVSMLLADRVWAFQMIAITRLASVFKALLFYYMMYQSKLIPPLCV